MTSVAPTSPSLVLQTRFQVPPGAQSLHPTQVLRPALPGVPRFSRRPPPLTAPVPRAALRSSRVPQGPARGEAGWPPESPEPPRAIQPSGRRQQAERTGGRVSSYRCVVQRRRPRGHLRPLRPAPATPPILQATRFLLLTEQGGRRQQPPGHVGVQGRGAGTGRGGSGHGAGRQRFRARGALATAPAGHVTADVTRAGRPSRDSRGAAVPGREGGEVSRERGCDPAEPCAGVWRRAEVTAGVSHRIRSLPAVYKHWKLMVCCFWSVLPVYTQLYI